MRARLSIMPVIAIVTWVLNILCLYLYFSPHQDPVSTNTDTTEARLQRRISALETRVDAIASAFRIERQTSDYDQQRRINALIARENARDL